MSLTLKEIASKAGVSVPTVSMVLNEKGRISEETRHLVKRVAAELGYKRKPSQRLITVLGKTTRDLQASLRQAAAEYGYDIQVIREVAAWPTISTESPPAGLVVYGGQWDPTTLSQIASRYPTVLLGGHTWRANLDSIWVDNAAGMGLAVDLLLSMGHRSIGFINGPPNTPTSWEKRAGFDQAINSAPYDVHSAVVDCEAFSHRCSREAMLRLLKITPAVTAVILADMYIAVPVSSLLKELGIPVPEAISLIGFRDHDRLHTVHPPMTAIGFSSLAIARETLSHLVRRIHCPSAEGKRILFRPYIIERSSVAPRTSEVAGSFVP